MFWKSCIWLHLYISLWWARLIYIYRHLRSKQGSQTDYITTRNTTYANLPSSLHSSFLRVRSTGPDTLDVCFAVEKSMEIPLRHLRSNYGLAETPFLFYRPYNTDSRSSSIPKKHLKKIKYYLLGRLSSIFMRRRLIKLQKILKKFLIWIFNLHYIFFKKIKFSAKIKLKKNIQ